MPFAENKVAQQFVSVYQNISGMLARAVNQSVCLIPTVPPLKFALIRNVGIRALDYVEIMLNAESLITLQHATVHKDILAAHLNHAGLSQLKV